MIYKTGDHYVCMDCAAWLANGDATGLDYYYDEAESQQRLDAIQEGEREIVRRYGQIHVVAHSLEFFNGSCACCGHPDTHGQYLVVTYTEPTQARDIGLGHKRTETMPQFIVDIIIDDKAPGHNSATGYGNKLPSQVRLHCADNRIRRVYAICYSNVSTAYILYKGERILIDIDTEHAIHEAYQQKERTYAVCS